MSRSHRGTYTGIFLVALATLVLEILLTRITSVMTWYHMAFFVISLVMLGMTAGAVIVFALPAQFPDEGIRDRMVQSSLGFALLAPLSFGGAMSMPLPLSGDLAGFVLLLGYAIALGIPFVFAGIAITLGLTRAGLPPGRIYAADLIGASLGCVAVIPLLQVIDAPSGILVAAATAALGAFVMAPAGDRLRRPSGLVALALIVGAVISASADPPLLRPAFVKGQTEPADRFMRVDWNTHSRVTVEPTVAGPPHLWAALPNMPAALAAPVNSRMVKIDGAAATLAFERGDDLQRHPYLDWDLASIVHRLRPEGAAAIIGVGAGPDVIAAKRAGHDRVLGMEINQLIVDLHERVMPEFTGIASMPGVELVADEARSYLARDQGQYATITMSVIDTWAASGAGAMSLSENGLYTVEAWSTFLTRLRPDGMLSVSRFWSDGSPYEAARMAVMAMEVLHRRGVERPLDHILLLQAGDLAVILVSPSAYTPADLALLASVVQETGVRVLLSPGQPSDVPLLAGLQGVTDQATLWQWSGEQLLDITPATDSRPFFFNMLKPGGWFRMGELTEQLELATFSNLQATRTLVTATAASLVLTLLAIGLPLASRRRELRGSRRVLWSGAIYFALIGLGFMFVEIALLTRLNVFLGHPTLGLAVLLGGLILSTGLGSLLSERIPTSGRTLSRLYPLIPAAAVLLAGIGSEVVMGAFAAQGTVLRVGVSLLVVAPTGLGMGLCFPMGLRLVGEHVRAGRASNFTPWLWGINGGFGVCASGLALATTMSFGLHATLAVGTACYLLLLPVVRTLGSDPATA
jgi:hypothetical protein